MFSLRLRNIMLFALLFIPLFIYSGNTNMLIADNNYDGDVILLKDTLFAQTDLSNLNLEFKLQNKSSSKKKVIIKFKLKYVDYYNSSSEFGTETIKLTAIPGISLHTLKMKTRMDAYYYNDKNTHCLFNIEYTLQVDKKSYSDLKSLYIAEQKYNMYVFTEKDWIPDSNIPVRIMLNSKGNISDAAATLLVSNKDEVIYEETKDLDQNGECLIEFRSPKEQDTYNVEILLSSKNSDIKENYSFEANIIKDKKIYITTDKPMYQPGQEIKIRSLTLNSEKIPVSNEPVIVSVYDGSGNKVFKEKSQTNEFGIASASFQLASFVNLGLYKIEIEIDSIIEEKTVTVERYVLPKFKVQLDTDKSFYKPGDNIQASINGKYFFGKPVSDSEVTVNLYTFDVEWNLITSLTGFTNKNGDYDFSLKVPEYLIGAQFEQGAAYIRLEVLLTDNADHMQKIDKMIPVSDSPIVIALFPENDKLVMNVPSKFYIVTTDPLGKPIATNNNIIIKNNKIEVETNNEGFSHFIYEIEELPLNIKVESKTKELLSTEKSFSFNKGVSYQNEHIVLMTNNSTYKVGDIINLDILTSTNVKKVYIDIIKEKKTLLTKSIKINDDKKTSLNIPVDSDMNGVIKMSAYSILSDSSIVRDSKLLYIDNANDLSITMNPDKDEYLPGENAVVNINVKDINGNGKQSALGIVIVDEAVYALQDNKPGLEKIFFEIEEELKEPKFEIHAFTFQNVFYDREIDNDKAEIFLAANNKEITKGVEYSSGYKNIDDVKQHLTYIIDEIFYIILTKMKNYIGYDYDENTIKVKIERIVNNNLIPQKDLWNKDILITFDGDNVSIISAGMDQIFHSYDDFVLTFNAIEIDTAICNLEEKLFILFEDFMGGELEEDFEDAQPTNDSTFRNEIEDQETSIDEKGAVADDNGDGDSIRVRKYFPETLYFEPAMITDENGNVDVSLTVADSITTWRISSTANSKDGELGSDTAALRVFQEFFIDIDFPVSLTQNDRVSVPIAIYNYLQTPQTIELSVLKEDWFNLAGDSVVQKKLGPNEVSVEYFTITAKEIGTHRFQVRAKGSTKSDAIERKIKIKPDGDPINFSYSDRLKETVLNDFILPEETINNSQQVIVKIYPGLFSQVVEGLDSLFKLPSGCFEQTSSTTYPNILALRYMQEAEIISPEIELKAATYINQGYQRLLTFEVRQTGGFEWFGNYPAHNILTAYGLMEFYDMSFVHNIDMDIITRTQNYLLSRQQSDGSFPPDNGGIPEGAINAFQNNVLRNTGYILWALAYSEFEGPQIDSAVSYITKYMDLEADSYTLAILANALLTVDQKSKLGNTILKELDNRKQETENDGYYWSQELNTGVCGSGNVAVIETTALIAHAMIIGGQSYLRTVEKAINYLITQKDSFGNWSSTQSTIATLRTFVKSLQLGQSVISGDIDINVNNERIKSIRIDESNYDVMQQIDISQFIAKGSNNITITMKSEEISSYLYQIAGVYYVPKNELSREDFKPLTISVSYDKTNLSLDDTVNVNVNIANNYTDVNLEMLIVDLGIAPGFDVLTEDFESYLENNTFSKIEPAGRQLILYIQKMKANEKISFNYRMKARYPMKVKSPSFSIYSYYGEETDVTVPPELEVNE